MLTVQGKQPLLALLPAVHEILEHAKVREFEGRVPRPLVVLAAQRVLAAERERILADSSGNPEPPTPDRLADQIGAALSRQLSPGPSPVINATGVILHTNLGRAPLAEAAIQQVVAVARSFSALEYDLEKGKRGSRHSHLESLLCELTGAEAAFAINNNAGAVLLALNTVANGKEVIVSRGELVEIGGSFRIPDIMRSSGASLVEVGTTNRTHAKDYEAAVTEETAALLKVHLSNFDMVGFTKEVSIKEMAAVAKRSDLPLLVDMGSGCLTDLTSAGVKNEPVVMHTLRAGADVVTFSGDKLLGGPQAGILAGRAELIEPMRKNPLARALRADKLTIAALAATLRLYLDKDRLPEIPTMAMILATPEEVRARAERLHVSLTTRKLASEVVPSSSAVGGGSNPSSELASAAVALNPQMGVQAAEKRLRAGSPPVIARVKAVDGEERILLDLRTVKDEEIEILAEAVESALKQGHQSEAEE